MTLLSVVYASAPTDEVIISTLEIQVPGDTPIRICTGFEDLTLGVGGVPLLFEAASLSVSLPAKNTTGQQSLMFGIPNTNSKVQRAVDAALEANSVIPLVYREYLSSDLTVPAKPPYNMVIAGGQLSGGDAQIEASYYDLLNTAYPRERYTAETAPGLKYL